MSDRLAPSDDDIVDAYESWDGSVDRLADHLHISRQTVYNALARKGVLTKRRRQEGGPRAMAKDDPLLKVMADAALSRLIEDNYAHRREVEQLRQQVAVLEAAVAAYERRLGASPPNHARRTDTGT